MRMVINEEYSNIISASRSPIKTAHFSQDFTNISPCVNTSPLCDCPCHVGIGECSHEIMNKSCQQEKGCLLKENNELKIELNSAYDKIKEQTLKNKNIEEELIKFKRDELCNLKTNYEKMIQTAKEDDDQKIEYLNNQLNALAKENVELKLKLSKQHDDERASLDK